MVAINSEKRKIQLTGGSTYIVSLPIKWVRENGLSAGDALVLSSNDNSSLMLAAESIDCLTPQHSQVEISLTGNPGDDFRVLVSNYLIGYDVISIVSTKGFTADERKFIKESARRRLIGIEIVEESRNKLVLQSLLNYKDISLEKSINTMFRIISSMHEDVLIALMDNDMELAYDVIQRDDDVDRFYLLTVRQLKASVDNSSLAQKIGIDSSKDCLGYRLVTKSMERVGDHVQRIAQNIIEMDSPIDSCDEIIQLGNLSLDIFSDSVNALYDVDSDFANRIIERSNKNVDIISRIYHNQSDNNSFPGEQKRNILLSFQRISEYSADIAEIIINMHAKRLKDSAS